jgi:hypothetical protein
MRRFTVTWQPSSTSESLRSKLRRKKRKKKKRRRRRRRLSCPGAAGPGSW